MKTKVTVTLNDDSLKYLNIFADKHFEGNNSMALRRIVIEHEKHSIEDKN